VARKVRFEVGDEDAGVRLDKVLAARVPDLSRRKARVLLDIGGVFVDGARTKVASRKVRPGQVIVVNIGGALERATKEVGQAARERDAAALPDYQVVVEDEHLVVVAKPAGLLTAPTPESDRGNLADLLSRRPSGRVFVVHRIDLQTSGLLVFARTAEANRRLSEAFRTHDIDREYLAVVDGMFPDEIERISVPLRGKRAVTHVSIEERYEEATLIRARLETGRTHQIRLHCRDRGYPVLGDPEYGHPVGEPYQPPRMALHAEVLGFQHPATGERVRFTCPWPEDLRAWRQSLPRVEQPDGDQP
jgi:23S rRNA pseudouridine1911/1915/1917 synthase